MKCGAKNPGRARRIPSDECGGASRSCTIPNVRLSADSRAICEYFEETVEKSPLISCTAAQRAEIRRLIALFDEGVHSG